jgi:hypothetical protein
VRRFRSTGEPTSRPATGRRSGLAATQSRLEERRGRRLGLGAPGRHDAIVVDDQALPVRGGGELQRCHSPPTSDEQEHPHRPCGA